jgi:hemerythrin-like metal-binding protein
METIPLWDASMSVGNAEIDEQHRQLLALNQRAAELIANSHGTHTRKEIRRVLNDIVDLVETHLATEERMLSLNGCPTLAEHKAEHSHIIELLADLIHESMLKDLKSKKVASLLADYIQHHFQETDMRCREYMREKPTT